MNTLRDTEVIKNTIITPTNMKVNTEYKSRYLDSPIHTQKKIWEQSTLPLFSKKENRDKVQESTVLADKEANNIRVNPWFELNFHPTKN